MRPNLQNESNDSRRRARAALELVFAGALWGFGFVAAIWALRAMGPLSVTGWRFTLGAAIGFAILLLVPRLRREITLDAARFTFLPGLMISVALILQTYGLRHTTATKSGFLTTLYAIIVPLIERFWFKTPLMKGHGFAVFFAMAGVALMCDLGALGGADWNVGDVLTIGCAFAAAVHIVWLGRIQDRIHNAFAFNVFQSLWAGLPALALAIWLEPTPRPSMEDLSAPGLLSLIVGSTLIAFALQVKAQKVLSPSLVSLLFLLESPFATFFGMVLLGESLRAGQWIGAAIILATAGYISLRSALGPRQSETRP